MTTTIEKKHRSFPSIEQFRNAIRNVSDRSHWNGKDENGDPVFDRTKPLPAIDYVGTVKLHGTNAGVVLWPDGTVQYQSRERIIALGDDNAGFVAHMQNVPIQGMYSGIIKSLHGADAELTEPVCIYGEWCGGSIQAKVALNRLPKMFVVFAIKTGEEGWLPDEFISNFNFPEFSVYNSTMFKTYKMRIDFSRPADFQNDLVELTNEVEQKCPAGEYFGVEGAGEGIVWRPADHETGWISSKFWFKVKGEKHQNSKVKTLAPVDMEKINSIREAVDRYVTEPRLEQGLDKLREMGLDADVKNTGEYLRWIVGDVWKEHGDEIEASGLTQKELNPEISKKARPWFFNRISTI